MNKNQTLENYWKLIKLLEINKLVQLPWPSMQAAHFIHFCFFMYSLPHGHTKIENIFVRIFLIFIPYVTEYI